MRYFIPTLLGVTLCLSGLHGWERKAKEECELDKKNCLADAKEACRLYSSSECDNIRSECESNYQRCLSEAGRADEASFNEELGFRESDHFDSFSHEEKNRAMDYADHNKMSPVEAVEKVIAERG